MSKELEALEKVYYGSQGYGNCDENYKIVEQALHRLEAIDNAEPSEALECSLKLYKMAESAGNGNGFNLNEAWKYHKTIKQALLKEQKEHKALEIIKEKPQAELSLIQLGKIKTYEEYLNYTNYWELDLYGDMVYTEEEFNLLKEVLE